MQHSQEKEVVIIGAGIGGLTLALALHRVGIRCRIYESVTELKPLGVGLNLLPHAMKELARLGLQERLLAKGQETRSTASSPAMASSCIASHVASLPAMPGHRCRSIAVTCR